MSRARKSQDESHWWNSWNCQQSIHSRQLFPCISNDITKDFCNQFGISKSKQCDHYQLHGSTNTRYENNVANLAKVFEKHDLHFGRSDDVYVVTEVVLPSNDAEKFLAHAEIDGSMLVNCPNGTS